MVEFPDTDMEPFLVDGLLVPLIRLTSGGPPRAEISVAGQPYQYDRSYPYKGYSAVLPHYLKEQLSAGKKPLLIERPDRLYVYFAT